MNGPDHYSAAERLLDLASRLHDEPRPKNPADVGAIGNVIALAQVHATLALAAATAADRLAGPLESWGGTTTSVRDSYEWEQATA